MTLVPTQYISKQGQRGSSLMVSGRVTVATTVSLMQKVTSNLSASRLMVRISLILGFSCTCLDLVSSQMQAPLPLQQMHLLRFPEYCCLRQLSLMIPMRMVLSTMWMAFIEKQYLPTFGNMCSEVNWWVTLFSSTFSTTSPAIRKRLMQSCFRSMCTTNFLPSRDPLSTISGLRRATTCSGFSFMSLIWSLSCVFSSCRILLVLDSVVFLCCSSCNFSQSHLLVSASLLIFLLSFSSGEISTFSRLRGSSFFLPRMLTQMRRTSFSNRRGLLVFIEMQSYSPRMSSKMPAILSGRLVSVYLAMQMSFVTLDSNSISIASELNLQKILQLGRVVLNSWLCSILPIPKELKLLQGILYKC